MDIETVIMNENKLSIRICQETDIEGIADYFLSADSDFLKGMGLDKSTLPKKAAFLKLLEYDINENFEYKDVFYLIWILDNKPVGHCNVTDIIFGREAYMHLHLWTPGIRQKGFGNKFVKMFLPYFFERLKLKTLYCEPYAFNPAPNKMLKKSGFEFTGQYEGFPEGLASLKQ